MRWALGAAALLAVAALWYVFVYTPPVTNHDSQGTDIIAIGDSLVSGTGSTYRSDVVTLTAKAVGQPIENLGRSGDTTADVLLRLKELDAYKPKVVIVLVGGNDYLRKVSDDEVFGNLAKIIEDIQGRGAMVLLVGIRGGVLTDPYAPRFKELSRHYKTAYVPNALDGLFGNKKYMSDQVHPNDAGYAILASRIAPVLQDLLQ